MAPRRWPAVATGLLALGALAAAPAPSELPGNGADLASQADAAATLRAADDTLRRLLGGPAADSAGRRRAVTAQLGSLFDIDTLAARALGAHWQAMPPAERRQLVGTLRTLVERNYLSQLEGQLDYRIDYGAPRSDGADVWVPTRVRGAAAGASTFAVDYRMHRDKGRWWVFDVCTEGASLVDNYRAQFSRIIAKEGTAGILRRLAAKAAGAPARP